MSSSQPDPYTTSLRFLEDGPRWSADSLVWGYRYNASQWMIAGFDSPIHASHLRVVCEPHPSERAPALLKADVEADPTGRSLKDAGAKADAGKPRPALVLGGFAPGLAEVVKVGSDGAAKYTPNGWLSVPNGVERYEDALLRHLLKHLGGEQRDPDSGSRHMAHVAWNALALLTLTKDEA